MSKHRLVIYEIPSSNSGVPENQFEPKVFEQCFDNLDLHALVLAVNKRPRVRKSRAADKAAKSAT